MTLTGCERMRMRMRMEAPRNAAKSSRAHVDAIFVISVFISFVLFYLI